VTDTELTSGHGPAPAPPPTVPRGEIAGGGWRVALLAAAVVALGVLAGRSWLLIIGALFVMIFLHELGHFLTAKWSGMKVTEFFLFFGPKLWSFRRGETEYGIKLIPLGAYVRIIGMNNIDEVPPEDEPRTYRQQSYPKRLLVVSAGSIMHFLQAFVLFVVVFGFVGVPAGSELALRIGGDELDESTWVVGNVVEGSAAEEAGLRAGDDIVSIDGERLVTFGDVGPLVADRAGDEIALVVDRGGEPVELTATIGHRPDEPDAGFLGVSAGFPDAPPVTASPGRTLSEAGSATTTFLGETVTSLTSFFTGGVGNFASTVVEGGSGDRPTVGEVGSGEGGSSESADQDRLVSIYGVARIGASVSEDGMGEFLILLALVNISIGVLNLIPLLPLDGGHVAIATYERIRSIGGRRHMADVSRLLPLTYAVVMILLLLGVSSIYLDIVDPIGVG